MKKHQVQKVIDNLNKVLPIATKDEQFHIGEGRVNKNGHVCGTVHCLGGWYTIATLDMKKELDYLDGANQLAKDLGFINYIDLENEMGDNSRLWGNGSGSYIFLSKYAFKSEGRPDGAKNLKDIIDHFEEVRDRLNE